MNKTRKTSVKKKLISAIAMLTVSAVTLSTATYAWFTMSREVSVTGMTVKTQIGANLLISSSNAAAGYGSKQLSQTRSALLEPVSSINATNESFYYTVNADGRGDAKTESYTLYSETLAANKVDLANTFANKTAYDKVFNGTYDIQPSGTALAAAEAYKPAYGYVDYVFYLKATGADDYDTLNMTKCELVYDDDTAIGTAVGATGDQAWRVAVFSKEITADGAKGDAQTLTGGTGTVGAYDPASDVGNLVSILKLSSAGNFTSGEAVNSTTTTDDVVNPDTAVTLIDDLGAGSEAYFKVTVRLWLEGEDTTCKNSTYAELSDAWSLNLKFELEEDGTNAVTNIGSDLDWVDLTPEIN